MQSRRAMKAITCNVLGIGVVVKKQVQTEQAKITEGFIQKAASRSSSTQDQTICNK